jgi:uncharacterized protein
MNGMGSVFRPSPILQPLDRASFEAHRRFDSLPVRRKADNTQRMSIDWSEGPLAEGLRCYQNEEFFLAHEHWESVWLAAEEPEKTFLQGLIQITAAFHHLKRRNFVGAASLLRAALRRLDPLPPVFGGLDVARLRESTLDVLISIDERDDHPRIRFPQI